VAEVLTNDVAEARGAIDRPNPQLPAEAAQTAQLPGQEREQTATLMADDEAVQLKQAVESALAEARQSLEKEQRAEVLTNDLAGPSIGPIRSCRRRARRPHNCPDRSGAQTATLMQDATAARLELTASTPTAPPDRSAQGGDNWIISETTSPVDYTPIVTATTSSRGGSNGSSMRLSIYCRGGRTELVVAGPAVSRAAGITPFPIALMTIGQCNLRHARHRLEPALRSRAMSYACCSRSPKRGTSSFASPPDRVPPRTGIFCSAD